MKRVFAIIGYFLKIFYTDILNRFLRSEQYLDAKYSKDSLLNVYNNLKVNYIKGNN